MTKLINKSKCEFEYGFIVKKDKVVFLPHSVYLQLMKLENMVQQHAYLKQQDPYCPGPSLDGFEFKSALKNKMPFVEVTETPVADKRVEEAMLFMEEMDNVDKTNKINEMIDRFADLIRWCQNDKFIATNCPHPPIDTYMIGDPLLLTDTMVCNAISKIVTGPVEMEK